VVIENETIQSKMLKVLRINKKPIAISYELIHKRKGKLRLFYGKISLDKKYLYSGLFMKWHKLNFNESTGLYEFNVGDDDDTYFVYREVINLVDNYLVDTFITGGEP
jgi:hypothetical protein